MRPPASAPKPEKSRVVRLEFSGAERPLLRLYNARAKAEGRTLAEQIQYYAKLGSIACDHPDLPMPFIVDIIEGLAEIDGGLGAPYEWEPVAAKD